MHITNRPTRLSGTASLMSMMPRSSCSAHAIAATITSSGPRKIERWYQPRPSKHSMKVRRYSVSGRIHRNGTEATSCVMWLVTASSMNEPIAESSSHAA